MECHNDKSCKNCYSYEELAEVCEHEDMEQMVMVNYKTVRIPFAPPDDKFCCSLWR